MQQIDTRQCDIRVFDPAGWREPGAAVDHQGASELFSQVAGAGSESLREPTIIVELTGARGVGKSTVAAALAKDLGERGIACNRARPEGALQRLQGRVLAIVDLARALWIFGRWRPDSRAELHKLSRRYLSLRQAIRRAEAVGGVHVLDEGTWHLIMTTYIKTAMNDMRAIRSVLEVDLRLPDVVGFVVGSEEAVAERRRERDNVGDRRHPRIDSAGRDGLAALRTALDAAVACGAGMTCLTIDSEAAEQAVELERLADVIASGRAVDTAAGG